MTALLLLLGGCQTAPRQGSAGAAVPDPLPDPATTREAACCGFPDAQAVVPSPAETPAARLAIEPPSDLWARLRAGFRLADTQHPRIDSEVRRLQRSPFALEILLNRAAPYMHYLLEAVEGEDLPTELVLLPAIESSYRPFARSPNGAAGLWQFMPATGKMLGLRQDWWYDGRRDIGPATAAALQHIEDLNRQFDGDWLHALAAYNAGSGTLRRALRKARARQAPEAFWDLDLPKETDRYPPRLLALARVIATPERYGLTLPDMPDEPFLTALPTDGQIDLKVAADLAGLAVEDLLLLNPGFKRWSTPPEGPHRLLLPITSGDRFSNGLAALPRDRRVRWKRYRIQAGDSLGGIAHKYGVSVQAIQRANKLRGTAIRAGRHLAIPLSSEAINGRLVARTQTVSRSRLHYRVRKGDSLYKIAQKFRVKVADLRRWNKVERVIRPGQRLTLMVDPRQLASNP